METLKQNKNMDAVMKTDGEKNTLQLHYRCTIAVICTINVADINMALNKALQ